MPGSTSTGSGKYVALPTPIRSTDVVSFKDLENQGSLDGGTLTEIVEVMQMISSVLLDVGQSSVNLFTMLVHK